ncbi:CPBP family intramembrane glutamic endopeptidase [Vibrio chemaguriensis]
MKSVFCALFGSLLFLIIGVLSYKLGIHHLGALAQLAIPHVFAIIIGGGFYWLCCTKPKVNVSNKTKKKVLVLHLAFIFALYFIWSILFHSEDFVDNFFVESELLSNLVKLVTIMLLAPISEELIYRGIVFGSLASVKPNKYMVVLAALVSSCIFTVYHYQYEHISTFVLLYFVGMLLCSARYFSKTLWIPVVVHSFASLCAISL